MPKHVLRYGIEDGDYTLDQIKSNSHLSVLLPCAAPFPYVTRVADGWASPVKVATIDNGDAQPPDSETPVEPDLDLLHLPYGKMLAKARALGYKGGRKKQDIVAYIKGLAA